jgi:hypothetical protein
MGGVPPPPSTSSFSGRAGSVASPSRPDAEPEGSFDDRSWNAVDLPHDWAIKGPFYEGPNAEVGGGMGRLPSPGVAWYRRKLDIPAPPSCTEMSVRRGGDSSEGGTCVLLQLLSSGPSRAAGR